LGSFCINDNDIHSNEICLNEFVHEPHLTVVCDCRLKIHIPSTGRQTSSKRDSIDDEQWRLNMLLNGDVNMSSDGCFFRTVH